MVGMEKWTVYRRITSSSAALPLLLLSATDRVRLLGPIDGSPPEASGWDIGKNAMEMEFAISFQCVHSCTRDCFSY